MNIGYVASRRDLLGVLAFLYIIFYAVAALRKKRNLMNWILLLVGIGGFIVDLFVVVNS